MSGKEKPDPEYFPAASTWELRHHSAYDGADHSYFFSTDDYKENSILSEFDWNIPPQSSGASNRDGDFADFPPIEPDLTDNHAAPDAISSSIEPMMEASATASASPSNPSVSSSSSEDRPEKSTAAADPPPEAAQKIEEDLAAMMQEIGH